MNRTAMAIVAAALMSLTLAPVATATDNPYAGVWTSIDRFDGSTQILIVSGGSAPSVTYQDLYARTCSLNGSGSTHWVANGRGTILDEGMAVDFTVAGCGSYRWDGYPAWYFLESGTLYDNFENAWHRIP